MTSDQFYLFAALASFNRTLQERLRNVDTPQEIIQLAADQGYHISIHQLEHHAGSLTASHWVWNNHEEPWRNEFFSVEHG